MKNSRVQNFNKLEYVKPNKIKFNKDKDKMK